MSAPTSTQQVILVTGANKGIGYEAVKLLAHQQPHSTILLGTRSLHNGQQAIQRMKDEHTDVHFDNVHPIVLDVADKPSIERAVAQLKAEHGQLNVLINNSGISNASMCKYDRDTAYSTADVMAVNVYGTRDTTIAFLPLMPPHDSHIIIVSSEVSSWTTAATQPDMQATLLSRTLDWPALDALVQDWSAALDGRPSQHEWPSATATANAYGPSKALVSAYTRILAREQDGQRTVVAVTPGLCATALSGGSGRSAQAGGASVVWPVGRWSEVEQGTMYQDGNVMSWCHARGAQPKPHR